MHKTDFDWKGGKVTFWDLDRVDTGKEAASQLDELKEDLAQIEFARGCILDVGWCPEFAATGRFIISVVRSSNWDSPLWQAETKRTQDLSECIRRGIAVVTGLDERPGSSPSASNRGDASKSGTD